MAEDSGEDFVFVGSFSPREIKRVTHYLEGEDVDYEVEFDDSERQEMLPIAAAHGIFPAAPTVKLYIDPRKRVAYEAVIETLYPT